MCFHKDTYLLSETHNQSRVCEVKPGLIESWVRIHNFLAGLQITNILRHHLKAKL